MKGLAAWSLKNRATVDVLILAWILGGLYSAYEIRREFFPEISFDSCRVVTILPGSTPEDVERLITDPIEDAVVDLTGVDHVISTSNEGRSEIWIFADPDNASIEEVMRDVERAVDLVDNLPDDAEEPQVIENKAQEPVLVVALLSANGHGASAPREAPWETRKRIADALEERIRTVSGVAQIVTAGLRDREFVVEVDPGRLAVRNLSSADVVAAIRAADADLPAGLLRAAGGDLLVRTVGEITTPDSVAAVVVRAGPTPSEIVRVGDVANVRETLADERTRSRINGKAATILTVLKTREGDVLSISKRLHELVSEERGKLPEGLVLEVVQDRSEWVQERLDMAWVNGLQGFVLVLLLLAIFLDIPSALWCAYGIVSAMLGATLILYATGGTWNMLTIFGYILVLGMLDDDAISVVENVSRYREAGLDPEAAVIQGAGEVAAPLTASILTTMASLAALAMMSGIMGKFMAQIPMPGIYALLATLLEALITLPVHLHMTATWKRPWIFSWPMRQWDKVRGVGDAIMNFLRRSHRSTLYFTLRYRYLFLFAMVVILVGSIAIAAVGLRFELVSTRDAPLFTVEVEAPPGTSLDEMERIVAEAEAELARLPKEDVEGISSTIGIRRIDRGFEYSPEVAQIMVDLHEPEVRARLASVIMDEVRPRIARIRGAEVTVKNMGGGPPVGRPVSVRLSGDDWKKLEVFAEEMKTYVRTLPGATDVEDDLRAGKREVIVRPRGDAAALAGASPVRLATEVRAAVDGIEAAKVRVADDEVKIRVRYPEALRVRAGDIGRVFIPTPAGPAPLANLADLVEGRGLASVIHYDGRRTITVSADLARSGIESREANALVVEKFSRLARARGLGLDLGGEAEDVQKSMKSLLRSAAIALALIAIILVFQFGNFLQPLVILFTLPIAAIGVVMTLLLHSFLFDHFGIGVDAPMGLMPLIGLTALLGMVVNDAIVLVDFVNESRVRGAGRWRSILRSAWLRLRPITLASLTSAVGALPMAYTARGSSAFLAPMALVFGWGILFASFLTLLVTPTLLAVVDDVRIGRGANPKSHHLRTKVLR